MLYPSESVTRVKHVFVELNIYLKTYLLLVVLIINTVIPKSIIKMRSDLRRIIIECFLSVRKTLYKPLIYFDQVSNRYYIYFDIL